MRLFPREFRSGDGFASPTAFAIVGRPAPARAVRVGGSSGCPASGWTGWTLVRRPLSAGALAVPAPRPAAGPTPAFLQFLLGPANAPFSGHLLLGILDRKSTRLNSSHLGISYAVFCL